MRSTLSGITAITRRAFLRLTGGMAFMNTLYAAASGIFFETLPVRIVEKGEFTFHPDSGEIERGKKREPYTLVVDGLVRKSRIFTYSDIRSFPQVEQVSDFHCVEGWSVKDLRWKGFRFKEILDRIEPDGNATHVLFHAFGVTESAPKGQSHYIESFPLSELLDPERELLLAIYLNGRTLPEKHGGPLRLVTPYDLAYKSIKYISRIEFIDREQAGWWTLANPVYPAVARVPETRLRRK